MGILLALLMVGPQQPARTPPGLVEGIKFDIRSIRDGRWSDAATWKPARVPGKGDRVLVSPGTRVIYDTRSDDVIRLVQVVGTLAFARDRDTTLNVGILKVQNCETCSESGFACDFSTVNKAGEPTALPPGQVPTLEVGTPESPIPAEHTARIRLHYIEGMNREDAPALVCCATRMDLHGAPMSRTWVKLGEDARGGSDRPCRERGTDPAPAFGRGALRRPTGGTPRC